MHLPLHAGDSHHDGHCPGPGRDFREGAVFCSAPMTNSWFTWSVPGSVIRNQQVGGFLGYAGFPQSCPQPSANQQHPSVPGWQGTHVRYALLFLLEGMISKEIPKTPPPPRGLFNL